MNVFQKLEKLKLKTRGELNLALAVQSAVRQGDLSVNFAQASISYNYTNHALAQKL